MSQILDNKYNFSRHQTHTFHTLGHTSARSVQKFYWRETYGKFSKELPRAGKVEREREGGGCGGT